MSLFPFTNSVKLHHIHLRLNSTFIPVMVEVLHYYNIAFIIVKPKKCMIIIDILRK